MLSEDLRIKFFSKYSLVKISGYRSRFFGAVVVVC